VAKRLLQLQQLSENPDQSSEVVFTSSLKWKYPFGFKRNTFVLPDLDTINKAAYRDYQREKVYVKHHSTFGYPLDRSVPLSGVSVRATHLVGVVLSMLGGLKAKKSPA
jgi:hypothetical protein